MTVYNKATLHNLYIYHEVEEACNKHYLSTEIAEVIKKAHPVDLYIPNLFVKIGLAVLTSFICLCVVALLALLLNINGTPAVFLIFTGACCYAMLEVMTGKKKHYNSGADNALMVATVILIVTGIMFDYNGVRFELLVSLVTFFICLWLAIRFTDSLAAIASIIAFMSFAFYAYVSMGPIALSTFPFLLIIISGLLYYFSHKRVVSSPKLIYAKVWNATSVIALLAMYFWGNFYIVNSLTEEILHSNTKPLSPSWFFWVWTFALPVLYLIKGIKDKDLLLMRAGTLLIGMSILTWRYYYSILTVEAAMLTAGMILMGIGYLFMHYLRSPRYGFVFDNNTVKENKFGNLEAFAIGQMHRTNNAEVPETQFGGGSFGGAGAGTKY